VFVGVQTASGGRRATPTLPGDLPVRWKTLELIEVLSN
jgi:hypothetical protein